MRLPNVYTILPGIPFAKALATQLWAEYKDDLPALSDVQIYVPNRRSVRALSDMFLQVSDGQATLLPRLTPLGDIDEEDLLESDPFTLEEDPFLTPAIAPLERQILLTKMILARQDIQLSSTEAFRLAGDLASFLDRAHTEDVDLSKLGSLVIGDLAGHWQITCDFLALIIEHWPNILHERGEIDPAQRRNVLLEKKIQALQKNPPTHRVIAAGSTGSIAASAQLLDTIARLPNGCVVLPGLDPFVDDRIWDAIDETHPYYYQKNLIARMDIDRRSVQLWPNTTPPQTDVLPLLHHAMQPQSVFDLSNATIDTNRLNNVEFYAAEHVLHEAKIIALRLREVLHHPEKTAMVVTPDRLLAQHIQQEMQRWDIAINDSGGQQLSQTTLGSYLKLVAGLSASATQATHILSLMRHPLYRLHAPSEKRHEEISILEQALREYFVPHNDIRHFKPDETFDILADTLDALAPLVNDELLPLEEWIKRHIAAAETLSTTPNLSGVDLLWRNEEGEAASRLLLSLYEAAAPHAFMLNAVDYSYFIDAILDQVTLRPNYGTHPRVTILSNIEARLQHADLVILAGLNETVWPAQVKADAWLSRPMQQEIGFGSPDRRIGQSCLDFVTLFAMPHVCVTWSEKRDGTPVHPSRWIQQIFAVMKKNNALPAINAGPYYHWAKQIDHPETLAPVGAPAFSPPIEARPRKLPITSIGLWQKDPYGLYAQRILTLRPFNALDRQPDARDWGNASHKILERFITENAMQSAEPRQTFNRIADEVLREYPLNTSQSKAWHSKLNVIGDWLVNHDMMNHANAQVEVTKNKTITLNDKTVFEIYGRADHVDTLPNKEIVITDYKTGSLPSEKNIRKGIAPQLPLLGWLHDADQIQLRYIKLNGKQDKPVDVKLFKSSAELIEMNIDHLQTLLQHYYIDCVPYEARALGKNDYDDYRHLKRVAEWAALDDSGDDTEEDNA